MPAVEWLFKSVNTKNMLVQWKLLLVDTLGAQKGVHNCSWPLTEMQSLQSLYRSWEKQENVKAAVGRAVHLRECLLRELPLY